MARRKKYTVGLWMDINEPSGKPTGLQMWLTTAGVVKKPDLEWHTVILAVDADEALELGQAEYASKGTKVKEEEQAA